MNRPAPRATAVHAPLATRVAALEAVFDDIGRTRFDGLGLLHPALRVQALGFEPEAEAPGLALGVLVTPWFMNLLRLPLAAGAEAALPAPGATQPLTLAGQTLDFIGAQDERLGRYALCSLFSPMADFIDQAGAVATAQAVLSLLRPAPDPAVAAPVRPAPVRPAPDAARPATSLAAAVPARRGFLFGRSAAGGAR